MCVSAADDPMQHVPAAVRGSLSKGFDVEYTTTATGINSFSIVVIHHLGLCYHQPRIRLNNAFGGNLSASVCLCMSVCMHVCICLCVLLVF